MSSSTDMTKDVNEFRYHRINHDNGFSESQVLI
jgi:hypothetical protein